MNTRRIFLQQSAAFAAAASLPAAPAVVKTTALVDCNVTIGPWPVRDLPGKDVTTFVKRLRDRSITQAWAASCQSLFYRDLATANRTLHDACTRQSGGLLIPVGSVNPTLPAWKDDLQRCAGDHGMKAVRLHPNYHGYTLDDPKFLELLEAATAKKFLIQIAAQMEDVRTQHTAVRVPPVDFKPLADALQRIPEARVMVLNANRAMTASALQDVRVILDIAMLEGVGGVENLLKEWLFERLVFGSHSPLFYLESAKLKLQESELTGEQLPAITHGNAQRLLNA